MRTTITVADDVGAEMERLRREEGLGPSEALNRLARRGMIHSDAIGQYQPQSAPMGAKIDIVNIGEVLELLDEN